jgi:hypothetical protein
MRSPSSTLTTVLVVLLLAMSQSMATTEGEAGVSERRPPLPHAHDPYTGNPAADAEGSHADGELDVQVEVEVEVEVDGDTGAGAGADADAEFEADVTAAAAFENGPFIPEDSVALSELWAMLNSSDAGLSDGLTVGRRGPHGVRGLFASKRVVAGTPLAVLPNAAILSEVTLPADRIAPFAFCQGLNDLTPQILLALLLTEERADPRSRWTPYLSLLPEHFNSLPLFWPNELAAAWLHDSEAATLVRGQARTFLSEFRIIQQCEAVAHRFKDLTLENYIW